MGSKHQYSSQRFAQNFNNRKWNNGLPYAENHNQKLKIWLEKQSGALQVDHRYGLCMEHVGDYLALNGYPSKMIGKIVRKENFSRMEEKDWADASKGELGFAHSSRQFYVLKGNKEHEVFRDRILNSFSYYYYVVLPFSDSNPNPFPNTETYAIPKNGER